ncbi:MAG TPA: FtsX-like permease family protein, partial [Blastocatellia bacterium]|nr:FtsX-like permease family protein [Blastocatellia bacterium]
VAELALCVPLAIFAGLLVKSFVHLAYLDPGFKADNVLASIIPLSDNRYPTRESKDLFFHNLLDRLRPLPGVQSAGVVDGVPLSGNISGAYLTVEGQSFSSLGNDRASAEVFSVSPDYLATMGIPILRGRGILERDAASGFKVAVINDLAAQRYWSGQDPIGKRVSFSGIDGPGDWRTIVGIAKATRDSSMDQPPRPALYVPMEQAPWPAGFLAVRTTGTTIDVTGEIRQQVAALDKDQPVFLITPMQSLVDNSIAPRRFSAFLLSIFGALATILAALGVYGVVSYSVIQRTREIGVRLALGASNRDVLTLVAGQGMRGAIVGVTIGLVVAFALSRFISNLLYGVTAIDSTTFVWIPLVLFTVALVASYLPARKALRVDPVTALRYE